MQDSKTERFETLYKFMQVLETFHAVNRIIWLKSGRQENDTEHSFFLGMFVILFQNDLPRGVNLERLIKMVLIHDLPEIYTGDVFAFDTKGRIGKEEREMDAAKKLFAQLPQDLSEEFLSLFVEFEERKTLESRIARAFDKLQPVVENILSDGRGWWEYDVTFQKIEELEARHLGICDAIDELHGQLMSEVAEKNSTREKEPIVFQRKRHPQLQERIQKIIQFAKTLDAFTAIERQLYVTSGHHENDAEHSWQLAMMVMLFEKDLPKELNVFHTIKIVLIHDLVEIISGDVSVFDVKARIGKEEREAKAAKKLFAQLPEDLEKEFHNLFAEYEAKQTLEAKVAKAFDKLQPPMQNLFTNGRAWIEHGLTYEQIYEVKKGAVEFDPSIKLLFDVIMAKVKDFHENLKK